MKTSVACAVALALFAGAVAQEFSTPCGSGACQSGQTCCSSSAGPACCPYPNAVCCSDGEHCCPSSAPVCDVSAGQCRSSALSNLVVPLGAKLPVYFASERVMTLQAGTAKDCSGSGALGPFSSASLTPSQPVKGQEAAIKGTGTLSKAVTGGNYNVIAKLNGAQVFSHTGNVCGSDKISLPLGFGTIVYDGLTCPEAAGSFGIGLSVTVPTAAPSASYTFQISSTDSTGAALFCLEADFSL